MPQRADRFAAGPARRGRGERGQGGRRGARAAPAVASFVVVALAVAGAALAGCARGGGEVAAPLPPAPRAVPAAPLALLVEGKPLRELGAEEMARLAPPVDVAVFDPLYRKPKRYRALPLRPLLEAGFGPGQQPLAARDFLIRARDGFTVPIAGSRLLEDGALLAFADLEAPSWEPVGETRALPGPLYLIWQRPEQLDPNDHPRPYQIAKIEIASVEQVFPHAVPVGLAAEVPAARGFRTFRVRCLACHAINRDGGRVGPDLNVPRSIVEYRPVDQIKAYIRNPLQFRYGHMPAHPDLSEGALDELVAYFTHMRDHKFDAEASPDAGAPAAAPR